MGGSGGVVGIRGTGSVDSSTPRDLQRQVGNLKEYGDFQSWFIVRRTCDLIKIQILRPHEELSRKRREDSGVRGAESSSPHDLRLCRRQKLTEMTSAQSSSVSGTSGPPGKQRPVSPQSHETSPAGAAAKHVQFPTSPSRVQQHEPHSVRAPPWSLSRHARPSSPDSFFPGYESFAYLTHLYALFYFWYMEIFVSLIEIRLHLHTL